MAIEIKAPQFPESVADGSIATWHKQPGEAVKRDELLVDIETDKVVLEVVAPEDGVLVSCLKGEGDTVLSLEVIATFEAGAAAAPAPAAAPAVEAAADSGDAAISPAARRLVDDNQIDVSKVAGSGKGGRITKEDIVAFIDKRETAKPVQAEVSSPAVVAVPSANGKIEKRVPMTRMRKSIAKRLLDAQSTAALLTTFNEVNMKPVMDLRTQYKDLFEKTHNGTRLGFMSFFVKAASEALKRFPDVNASIDGDDVVYHAYQDIGIAVSSNRGLVVPVLRNCESMSLAETEAQIRDFGGRAQKGSLGLEELQGGTFTITNGGVFGSMLSTPILNPPQSAILGMHNIVDRPVVVNGQIVVRPIMYLALSYDHRLIDGKEAVTFLVKVRQYIEEPHTLLFGA